MSELMARAGARRVTALRSLDPKRQADLGQFFTPELAASLVAGLPRLPRSGCLRVLDPGAGTGVLTAALVARVLEEAPGIEVQIVAVEVDPQVAPFLQQTLDDCSETAQAQGSRVTVDLVRGDYIDLSTAGLMGDSVLGELFDLVIMNPPYRKLAASSSQRSAVGALGVDCPNLYSAFLALGAEALRPGGQLVAITPRSFANGPYFGQFRRFLLDRVALDRLHVFESRSTVFKDTGVLQENVVFSGTRDGERRSVTLSISQSHTDEAASRTVDYSEVLHPDDPQRFIRIASGGEDTAVAESMMSQPATLEDLGIGVSTGRVVDFRSRTSLRENPENGCAPLIYPGNLRGGIIEWPRAIRKSQAFAATDEATQKLLVPAGHYVVVKRFSAKEERRRVVAAVWDPRVYGQVPVAFENHLNVFHRSGCGLDPDLAVGLSLWLNSSLVDRFFRTFSGHTQVNATDLRSLRFPAIEALRVLGSEQAALLPDQEKIDALVNAAITRTRISS